MGRGRTVSGNTTSRTPLAAPCSKRAISRASTSFRGVFRSTEREETSSGGQSWEGAVGQTVGRTPADLGCSDLAVIGGQPVSCELNPSHTRDGRRTLRGRAILIASAGEWPVEEEGEWRVVRFIAPAALLDSWRPSLCLAVIGPADLRRPPPEARGTRCATRAFVRASRGTLDALAAREMRSACREQPGQELKRRELPTGPARLLAAAASATIALDGCGLSRTGDVSSSWRMKS
jgi:hypothetical protein